MICNFKIIFLLHIYWCLNFKHCDSACARAEYETDGECCPMCAPGNRVYRDCTEYTSTTCVPCMDATFLDAPNGLRECFRCSQCDPGLGLRIKTACTRTSDTVCEPLDGHICTSENRGSCIHAKTHAKCSPGQYIKQRGTAYKDTVCDKCAEGSYSNGTLQNCQQHTKCEDLGQIEEKPGTPESDSVCGNKSPIGLIAGIIILLFLLILALVTAVLIYLIRKEKLQSPVPCPTWIIPRRPEQETTPEGAFVNKPSHSRSSSKPDTEIPLRGPQEMSEEELA